MKKRIVSLLLASALLSALMAGCGSTGIDASADSSAAPAVSEQAQTSAPAPTAAPQTDSAEESAEEPSTSEPAAQFAPYEWPLPLTEDGATFSISMMINPQLASYFAGYEDNPSWQEYSKRTGVNFEFQNISAMNIGEQYNLMFASGDYPDIMHSGLSYYSSGADAAVDDGVILDLAPYLEEYAPNYLYWVDKVGGFSNITTDEGYRPGFVHILDTPSITRSGPVTRGDWMEALNIDTPSTIDELHDMLLAMYREYGAQCEFDASASAFSGAWGTNLTISTFPSVSYPIYQVDGQVVYGPVTDEAKDYLQTMKGWLDEGILYKDFATRTSNFGTISDFAAGVFSYYNGDTDALATAGSYFTDPNATIVALPYAVRQEGDVIPFDGYHTSTSTLTGQGTFSITSSCPDVELAVSVLDWRYSEEGSFLFNYGIEGISFEYDANGEPQYTDLIVKNENGLSATWLAAVYMDEYGYVEKYTKFDNQMTQQQLEAREIWSDHVESRYDLPKALTLTAEEAELFSKNMADIASYTSESILKMLTGEMDIDRDYGTFVDTIYSMGLQDCIDCYQAALTRYNARSETA